MNQVCRKKCVLDKQVCKYKTGLKESLRAPKIQGNAEDSAPLDSFREIVSNLLTFDLSECQFKSQLLHF